jgi:hypothetical protein
MLAVMTVWCQLLRLLLLPLQQQWVLLLGVRGKAVVR